MKNGEVEAVLKLEIKDGLIKHMMMHPPQPCIKQEESAPVIKRLYDYEYKLRPYLVDQCSKRQLHPLNIADKEYIMDFIEGNYDKVGGIGMTSNQRFIR